MDDKVNCARCGETASKHQRYVFCYDNKSVFRNRLPCPLSESDILRAALAARDAQLARARTDAVQEHEASVCPEDFGCSELIASLERQLAEARAEVERTSAENERLVADYEAVHKQLAEARRERDEWSLALQSLTPGGSEYVDDPAACVATVRQIKMSQHEAIEKAVKARKAAETERDEWRKLCEDERGNERVWIAAHDDLAAQLREADVVIENVNKLACRACYGYHGDHVSVTAWREKMKGASWRKA